MKPKYFGYRSKALKTAMNIQNPKVAAESAEYTNEGDASRVALQKMIKDSFGTIVGAMGDLLRRMEEASGIEKHKSRHQAIDTVQKQIVGLNLNVLFGLSNIDEKEKSSIGRAIIDAGREFARRMVNPLRVLYNIPKDIKFFIDVGKLVILGRRLAKILDTVKIDDPSANLSGVNWVHAWVGKVGRVGKLGKVIGLLMASTQTVPLTAVWMLHLVGSDEDVRKQLRSELKALGVCSGADLTTQKIEQMKVAEAVVLETLRLYPPFPLIQRQAQADDVLVDTVVPAQTLVYVVPWLVHRNPKYWKAPHSFHPSRFLEGSAQHGDAPSDWVYIPFGRGSRMCAGYRLAIIELKVLLALAVLEYRWESIFSPGSRADSIYPDLGMFPTGLDFLVERI